MPTTELPPLPPMPSAFREVPSGDYFRVPYMSFSRLKGIAGSFLATDPHTGGYQITPRSYEARKLGQFAVNEQTDAMKIGTGAHAIVLEKDWRTQIRVSDSKPGGAGFFTDAKTTLTEKQFAECAQIAAKVRPIIAKLENSVGYWNTELSLFWQDGTDGVMPCKARLDWCGIKNRTAFIVDLKVTEDPRPYKFSRKACELKYPLQAAHYTAGALASLRVDRCEFYFLAVSAEPPRLAVLHKVSTHDLGDVEDRRQFYLAEIARRELSGDWTDPYEKDHEIWDLKLPKPRDNTRTG